MVNPQPMLLSWIASNLLFVDMSLKRSTKRRRVRGGPLNHPFVLRACMLGQFNEEVWFRYYDETQVSNSPYQQQQQTG